MGEEPGSRLAPCCSSRSISYPDRDDRPRQSTRTGKEFRERGWPDAEPATRERRVIRSNEPDAGMTAGTAPRRRPSEAGSARADLPAGPARPGSGDRATRPRAPLPMDGSRGHRTSGRSHRHHGPGNRPPKGKGSRLANPSCGKSIKAIRRTSEPDSRPRSAVVRDDWKGSWRSEGPTTSRRSERAGTRRRKRASFRSSGAVGTPTTAGSPRSHPPHRKATRSTPH